MVRNTIMIENYENQREIFINIIIDILDTMIINITKIILLLFMFIAFIITNAFIRNYYIYI
jgi:hypothetical protein